ncbi:LPXTG cell wall anchor domain-containing protein [Streptomyces varsoviensis]|uniref:LPXTG cell wall anchor domain-containing protein n=1 Tax=Streptomyces varsoviensis TaxID=67373 RepID=UPI0033C4C5F5
MGSDRGTVRLTLCGAFAVAALAAAPVCAQAQDSTEPYATDPYIAEPYATAPYSPESADSAGTSDPSGPSGASDPYAAGQSPGAVRIDPLAAVPGGEVALRVSGCRADKAVATSEAFVADVKLAKDADGLFGEAAIRSSVSVGEYAVTVACGGEGQTVQGNLTVTAEGSATAPASPVAPVPAGGGGTAPRIDDAGGPEPYGLVLAGGAALMLGGLFLHRRRRRGAPSGR